MRVRMYTSQIRACLLARHETSFSSTGPIHSVNSNVIQIPPVLYFKRNFLLKLTKPVLVGKYNIPMANSVLWLLVNRLKQEATIKCCIHWISTYLAPAPYCQQFAITKLLVTNWIFYVTFSQIFGIVNCGWRFGS